MVANKNHKFVVTVSMDDNIIASRARYVESYPESIIYSLRLNKLLNDMADLVEDALKENDIERVWGIMEGYKNYRTNKNRSRDTRPPRRG